jgi:hypothetical protein
MAAGMGSRFGGLKQIEPVGSDGKILLDFSVYDAAKAGFDKAVFIIRKDMEKDFREIVKTRIEKMEKRLKRMKRMMRMTTRRMTTTGTKTTTRTRRGKKRLERRNTGSKVVAVRMQRMKMEG